MLSEAQYREREKKAMAAWRKWTRERDMLRAALNGNLLPMVLFYMEKFNVKEGSERRG